MEEPSRARGSVRCRQPGASRRIEVLQPATPVSAGLECPSQPAIDFEEHQEAARDHQSKHPEKQVAIFPLELGQDPAERSLPNRSRVPTILLRYGCVEGLTN